jgi:hypothetical protein
VGNLLLEFVACGPDSKLLHSVALYGSDLHVAGTGVLVSSLLEVNIACLTGTSASISSESMVEQELCLTLFGIFGCHNSVAGDASLLEH